MMSAICGIFNLDGKPVTPDQLAKTAAALSHNGPDGSGFWREGPIGLSHLMLHTTLESLHETLPIRDAEKGLVLTSDARIDNRQELFEALEVPGREQGRMPDSALIMKAYRKWGEECPSRLVGSFAFAMWDHKERKVFCARDQIGFRPFHYFLSPRMFVFASEAKGVLSVPGVPRRLNELAVAHYLMQRHDNREITFYEDVLRLPAAHTLTVSKEAQHMHCYWNWEPRSRPKLSSDGEYAEALRELMFQAVQSCTRSAYPVGVMLSGGLDSSSVACVAGRKLLKEGKRLTAVCSALPEDHEGPETDEREYMEAVRTRESNIDLAYVSAEVPAPFDSLESQFELMDRPRHDLFWHTTDSLFSAAHERGVRALLDGFGGDMVASFLGIGSLSELARLSVNLTSRSGIGNGRALWKLLKTELVGPLFPDFVARIYRRFKYRNYQDRVPGYAINPDFARRMGVTDGDRQRTLPRIHRRIKESVSSGQTQLAMEDWAIRGASFGLDIRHPLLDIRLVSFCLGVPASQHLKDGYRRSLIRRAMEGVLPPKVLWRTTKGVFAPDYHRRVLEAKPWLQRFLSDVGDDPCVWDYVSKSEIEHVLGGITLWQGGTPWQTDAQRIVGRGVMMSSYLHWVKKQDKKCLTHE